MCGIAGKISFTDQPVDPGDMKAMARAIRHRGPDDEGIYINPDRTIGLSHTRLSVIDLSPAGHQPMSWNNKYWIVFNGEIYNFKSLRQKVAAPFHSDTDTEVILALYEQHGPACVEYLNGMFAFAIYDSEKNIVFCARDRFGQKPFKYIQANGTFLFASETKAILTQPEYRREPDPAAINTYLTFGFCPAPDTGFKDIHKLPPGHTLTVDISSGTVTTNRYWQAPAYTPRQDSPNWPQLVREKLTEAVTKRLVADVPLGAYLSGGLDSSIIVALTAQQIEKPKTFSIGFAQSHLNELPYARQVAQRFQTDHTELTIQPQDIESAAELAAHFDEPFADSSALPALALSKLTRRHVTVALSGDGGDEMFGGYARYIWLTHLARYGGLVHPISQALHQIHPSNLTLRLQQYTRSHPDAARQYLDMMSIFPARSAHNQAAFQPFFKQVPLVHGARQADIAFYLPDDLLPKVDITSMAYGLEVRSPFLDHTIIESLAGIPPALLRNKKILKEAFADLLPSEILQRKKQGFTLPLQTWLRGNSDSYLKSILLSPACAVHDYCGRNEIKRLLSLHHRRAGNYAPQLWALLMLELWFRTYFD